MSGVASTVGRRRPRPSGSLAAAGAAAALLACHGGSTTPRDAELDVATWRLDKYPALVSNHWGKIPAMPLDTRDILEMWPSATPLSTGEAERLERVAATLEVIGSNDDAPVSGVVAFDEAYAFGLTRRCRVVSWIRGRESIYMRANCEVVREVRSVASQRDRDWIDALCGCKVEE